MLSDRYEPFNEYENKVRVGEYNSGRPATFGYSQASSRLWLFLCSRFARLFDRLGGNNKAKV